MVATCYLISCRDADAGLRRLRQMAASRAIPRAAAQLVAINRAATESFGRFLAAVRRRCRRSAAPMLLQCQRRQRRKLRWRWWRRRRLIRRARPAAYFVSLVRLRPIGHRRCVRRCGFDVTVRPRHRFGGDAFRLPMCGFGCRLFRRDPFGLELLGCALSPLRSAPSPPSPRAALPSARRLRRAPLALDAERCSASCSASMRRGSARAASSTSSRSARRRARSAAASARFFRVGSMRMRYNSFCARALRGPFLVFATPPIGALTTDAAGTAAGPDQFEGLELPPAVVALDHSAGDQIAGHRGRVQAMPAEAAGQPDARRQFADLRHAMHRHAEFAGPGIIDLGASNCGKRRRRSRSRRRPKRSGLASQTVMRPAHIRRSPPTMR